MIWALVFAAAVQAPPAEKAAQASNDRLKAYAESLADAPDAVAWSLDKDGQLRKIYEPYFACYRDSLNQDHRSDLKDSSAAKLAFQSAYNSCASPRLKADEAAILYAARDTDLKDAEQRRRAIEYYRGWRGQIMLRDYYQQRGKGADFDRVVTEMKRGQ